LLPPEQLHSYDYVCYIRPLPLGYHTLRSPHYTVDLHLPLLHIHTLDFDRFRFTLRTTHGYGCCHLTLPPHIRYTGLLHYYSQAIVVTGGIRLHYTLRGCYTHLPPLTDTHSYIVHLHYPLRFTYHYYHTHSHICYRLYTMIHSTFDCLDTDVTDLQLHACLLRLL